MDMTFIVPSSIAIGSLVWNYFTSKKLASLKNQGEQDLIELKNRFEKSLLVHRIQFEKEFEIYKEVWNKVVELKWAVGDLIKVVSFDNGKPIKNKNEEKIEKVRSSHDQLINSVEKNRPFYSEEIYQSLLKINYISRQEMYSFIFDRVPGEMANWLQKAQKSKEQIDLLYNEVSLSIRKRIESIIDIRINNGIFP